MNKDIFYFSEKCTYCKKAFELIKKDGNDKYFFVNVEIEESLPHNIDRVPTIISSEDKKIYVEDDLFMYLLKKINIEPFMVHEMGGAISDRYSYIDNSGVTLDHSYQFLDKDNKINTPGESDTKKILSYDQYVAQRDNDLKIINT